MTAFFNYVQERMNILLRKILDYKSPEEIFEYFLDDIYRIREKIKYIKLYHF